MPEILYLMVVVGACCVSLDYAGPCEIDNSLLRRDAGILLPPADAWLNSCACHSSELWTLSVMASREKIRIWARDGHFQARLKRMTFSSEIEHFEQAIHQTPIFVGNSQGQDWKFQARLKFSSEIENFKRKLTNSGVQARLFFFKIRALWVFFWIS